MHARCRGVLLVLVLTALAAAGADAQTLRAPLTGSVVDEQGQPVVDAMVEVFRAEGRGFVCLDLDLRRSWPLLQRVPVDKHGRFGLQVPPGVVLRVQVQHPGHARWRRDDLTPGDELPIALGAPCTFRGQLVHRSTGAGTPGRLHAWDAQHTELFEARTDAEGRFAFDDLPAGRFTCEVLPDVAMAPDWFQGELVAGRVLEQKFELEPGVTLQGRVVDATSGQPIAGARVGENWTLDKAVVTGADGRYTMHGYGQAGAGTVECLAGGYERHQLARPEALTDPLTLDFALQPAGVVTGKIVDDQGRPCAGVYVAAVAMWGLVQWIPARTDADGNFALAGVHAGLGSTLLVRANGFATVVYQVPPLDRDLRCALGTLRLQAAEVVRGTVTGGDGKPLAEVEVRLWGCNTDRDRLAPLAGSSTGVDHYVAERRARTDAHGNFAFGDVPAGHYVAGFEATLQQPTAVAVDVEAVAGKPTPAVAIVR